MQEEKVFFRSEDRFVITGDQISQIAYHTRHQCGSKYHEDKIREILRDILKQETRQSRINKAMDKGSS